MIPKEQSRLRLAFAVILPAIGIGMFFMLDYGIQEIDYATGRIQTKHYIFNQHYRTTFSETWITAHVDHESPENWHRMWYTDALIVPQINSTGGKIAFQIRLFDTYLTKAQANQDSRKLVAMFIFDQLNQSGKDDREIFVIADRSFNCFFDELPFPEDPSDELTTEEVREIIRLCTNLNASPTISP